MNTNTDNAQHTPGPWYACGLAVMTDRVKYAGIHARYVGQHMPTCIGIADAEPEEEIDNDAGHLTRTPGFGEAEANARLIAAAPDLLAELEALVKHCEMLGFDGDLGEMPHPQLESARAAIAKAKGGNP